MSDIESDLVWYASYGSNCDASRFALYLAGGVLERGIREGASGHHRGARDPSLPLESAAMEFPSQITFAGHSKRWGQGVAFLEHRRVTDNTPGALGRRYLITRQQFEDVFAQENGRATEPIDFVSAVAPRFQSVSDGWYGALVALDPVDRIPVFTFTSTNPPEHQISNPPSLEYLRTIAVGLSQIHDLDMHAIVDRLRIPDAVRSKWTHDNLYLELTDI